VLQIIGETGTDLSKWATEKHFNAWSGLAPGSKDSGKRHTRVKRSRNRVGQLFCMLASSLARSKTVALGAFYRRLASRRGKAVAIKALARKLAAWFWRVMIKGDDYVEKGIADYEAQVRKGKERALRRRRPDPHTTRRINRMRILANQEEQPKPMKRSTYREVLVEGLSVTWVRRAQASLPFGSGSQAQWLST